MRKSAGVPDLHAAVRQRPCVSRSSHPRTAPASQRVISLIYYIWFSRLDLWRIKCVICGSTLSLLKQFFAPSNLLARSLHSRASLSSHIKTLSSPTISNRAPSQRIVSSSSFLSILSFPNRPLFVRPKSFRRIENVYLCHPERSAAKIFNRFKLTGAESKDPEDFSAIHTASGSSHDTRLLVGKVHHLVLKHLACCLKIASQPSTFSLYLPLLISGNPFHQCHQR